MPKPLDVRLPDHPNSGYSTRTQRELSDAVQFLVRGLERNRPLLLEVVIGGSREFCRHFVNAYRAIKADDEFAKAVFGYLVLLAGPNPDAQLARLELLMKQQAQARWDKRLTTALANAKDTQALLEAIEREERRRDRKPVRIFLQ